MKKYFLHTGTENSGPFDLDELKAKSITKTTPVWFEGMENWKYADFGIGRQESDNLGFNDINRILAE